MNVEFFLLNRLPKLPVLSESPQASNRIEPKIYVFEDAIIEPNSRWTVEQWERVIR